MRQTVARGFFEERPTLSHLAHELIDAAVRNIAAREDCVRRPRDVTSSELREQRFEHRFGESTVGRDLAAENREERGAASALCELDAIVARDLG